MRSTKLSMMLCIAVLALLVTGCEGFFLPYGENGPAAYDGELSWNREVADAPWSNRWDHAAVVFKDNIWVLGGYDPTQRGDSDSYLEDVWSSEDGVSWTLVTDDAPWKGRRGHGVAAVGDYLYVFGGFVKDQETGEQGYRNDIWKSSDGETWTEVLPSAPWRTRNNFGVVTLNDTVYIIGGRYNGVEFLDDVWKSTNTDLTGWTRITAGAVYGKRGGLAATADDAGNVYIQGGQYPDPQSADDGREDPAVGGSWGRIWKLDTATDSWSSKAEPGSGSNKRMYHEMAFFNGAIWLLPGLSNASLRFSNNPTKYATHVYDIGTNSWTVDSEGSGFGPRYGYETVVFDSKLWVLGGFSDDGPQNDVWTATAGGAR